jgi:hypothetical protein
MTEIRLHIDELILHGFDPRQRHAIADAVQAELTRLLTDSLGDPSSFETNPPASYGRVDAGTVDLASGTLPAGTGAALAAAIQTAIQPLLSPSSSTEPRDG